LESVELYVGFPSCSHSSSLVNFVMDNYSLLLDVCTRWESDMLFHSLHFQKSFPLL